MLFMLHLCDTHKSSYWKIPDGLTIMAFLT